MATRLILAQATFDPGGDGDTLLNLLAWCATAAGVFGLIVVGIMMAIKVFGGQPGEGGMYIQQFTYVLVACVLAAVAGPLTAMFV